MPTFLYTCDVCGKEAEKFRRSEFRNLVWFCPECNVGLMHRKFVPTANIHVHEHFRHLQSDFVPEKGDPAWKDLVPVSEARERQSTEVQDNFRKALESEFLTDGP
jgi:zinc ribbon protein